MSLNDLLATLAATLDPFVNGTTIADFDRLSPFTMLMIYRAAALVTQRLLVENTCQDNLRMLRIFRGFLRTVSERWLCCGKLSKKLRAVVGCTLTGPTQSVISNSLMRIQPRGS